MSEEGARILAEARADYPDNPDFVAAQRLAPYPSVPDTFTHERIAAALTAARREERELCARHIEARAIFIRDHGPVSVAGLLSSLAGAQVGALLDAAASLRGEAARTGPWGEEMPGPIVNLAVQLAVQAEKVCGTYAGDKSVDGLRAALSAFGDAYNAWDLAGTNPGDTP